jgi:hypothetical protein
MLLYQFLPVLRRWRLYSEKDEVVLFSSVPPKGLPIRQYSLKRASDLRCASALYNCDLLKSRFDSGELYLIVTWISSRDIVPMFRRADPFVPIGLFNIKQSFVKLKSHTRNNVGYLL